MAANPYNTATFNAAEYVALYPDLQAWWAGTVPGSEHVKDEWHNDRNAWALDHWTTHGQAEGRQGRSSIYHPDTAGAATAATGGTAAAAAKTSNSTWLLIGLAAAAGIYLYYQNKPAKS